MSGHKKNQEEVAESRWVTIQEAAVELGKHPKTIRRWISDRYLDARYVGPRSIQVDMASLERTSRPVAAPAAA